MADASRNFIKDGNKNRLRERDVYKITTVFNQRLELPHYSRFILKSEIEENSYNLNIPRYIDSGTTEDLQSIDGHLNGGIPIDDVESLSRYWETFPNLRRQLFATFRNGFDSLLVEKEAVRDTIFGDAEFSAYADIVEASFEYWKTQVDENLRTINEETKPKFLITKIATTMLQAFESINLVDKYDAYEVLLSYWNETMSDDVYLLVQDGYSVIRETETFYKETENKKTGVKKKKEIGWEGKLVPKTLLVEMFFAEEQKVIDELETIIAATQTEIDDLIDNAEEDTIIHDMLSNNEGNIEKTGLRKKLKDKLKDKEVDADDKAILQNLQNLVVRVDEGTKALKDLRTALDKKVSEQYSKLTDDECVELLINRKWYRSIVNGIYTLYAAVNHCITDRVTELANRYEKTLPILEKEVAELEAKVKSHLERMGFAW